MLKLFNYDYMGDETEREGSNFRRIRESLMDLEGVNYDFVLMKDMMLKGLPEPEDWWNYIEKILPEKDTLIVHPGASGQKKVLLQYPKMFPKLNIGFLFDCEGDSIIGAHIKAASTKGYKNITILDYQNVDKIIEYVMSTKRN